MHSHFYGNDCSTLESPEQGTFCCNNCSECFVIGNVQKFRLPNGKMFIPRQRTTCQMIGLVYLMICACGRFYVKTKREFHQRVYDHLYAIRIGKSITLISYYVAFSHNYNPTVLTFIGLEHIPDNPRGGDLDSRILQKYTRWISYLNATVSADLNDMLSYKSFLYFFFDRYCLFWRNRLFLVIRI